MRNNFYVILLALTVFSCQKSPESADYMQWVQDYSNGMRTKEKSGDVLLDLQYQPSPYVWIQRHGKFNRKSFDIERQELDNMLYFTLNISTENRSDVINALSADAIDKQRVLYYFSYQFQNDIFLIADGETIPCVLYHFERNADINNSRSIVLGFENKLKKSDQLQLVVNSELLNPLPVHLTVSKNKTSI